MNKTIRYLLAIAACLALILCAGCGKTGLSSTADTSSDTASQRPLGEALTDEEKAFEDCIYNKGFYTFTEDEFPTLEFSEAKSIYGEKSINIIGDSISHGMQSGRIYNNSWANLFKNSFNKQFGSNNYGYVSMLDSSGYGDTELHKLKAVNGGWSIARHVAYTPGFCTYSSSDSAGSAFSIELDRRADSYDRHINGFYIYYTAGPSFGGFEVAVNGTTVHTQLASSELDYTARTKYIAIPDGLKSRISITITKTDGKQLSICGIAYAESDSGVMINNYSLSGMTLCEINDELLDKLCQSNYVILALGYNDAGSSQSLDTFVSKLSVVSSACKKYGSTLIVLDFLWPKGSVTSWASNYKMNLFTCAQSAGGYYVDFTDMYKINSAYLLADAAHPTPKGYRLIARKLCYFFGMPFTSELG